MANGRAPGAQQLDQGHQSVNGWPSHGFVRHRRISEEASDLFRHRERSLMVGNASCRISGHRPESRAESRLVPAARPSMLPTESRQLRHSSKRWLWPERDEPDSMVPHKSSRTSMRLAPRVIISKVRFSADNRDSARICSVRSMTATMTKATTFWQGSNLVWSLRSGRAPG
jgi:hypothetical protein